MEVVRKGREVRGMEGFEEGRGSEGVHGCDSVSC